MCASSKFEGIFFLILVVKFSHFKGQLTARNKHKPCQTTWLVLVPNEKGNEDVLFQDFPSPEQANGAIYRLAGHLSGEYKVYQLTDKEFKLLKCGQGFREALEKQKKDFYILS